MRWTPQIIFENAGFSPKKGELRQNQFGVAVGGPVIKNKVFIFGDYEGLPPRQGTVTAWHGSHSAGAEQRIHQFTGIDYSQGGTETDTLGRTVPDGNDFGSGNDSGNYLGPG